MRPLFLFLSLLCASLTALSQDFERQGLIVLNNGDTLQGIIIDKEWNKSPAEIQFHGANETIFRAYKPTDIKAFATSRGVIYETQTFRYDADFEGTQSGFIAEQRQPLVWKETTVFVEVLTHGTFKLYRFGDSIDKLHYLIQKTGDTQPVELLSRMYWSNYTFGDISTHRDVTKANAVRNDSYKQQLVLFLNDSCTSLKKQINNLQYKEQPLTNFVTRMNTCMGTVVPAKQYWSTKKRKPEFGMAAAVFAARVDGVFLSSPKSLTYGGGIYAEFFSKKRPNRLSWYNELRFNRVDQAIQSVSTYKGYYIKRLEFNSISLTTMVRLNLKSAAGVYLNGGVAVGQRFKTIFVTKSRELEYKNGFDWGFALGVGKKFEILKATAELRVENHGISGTIINSATYFGLFLSKKIF